MLAITSFLAILLPLTYAVPTPGNAPDYSCSSDNKGFYLSGQVVPCSGDGSITCVPGTTTGSPCIGTKAGGALVASSAAQTSPAAAAVNTAPAVVSSSSSAAVPAATTVNSDGPRYVAYWSVWAEAQNMPTAKQLSGVTHLILAFANNATYTDFMPTSDPSTQGKFDATTVSSLRTLAPGLKIMAAFGGWNLDAPFRPASKTDASRTEFANKINAFIKTYNLDGVDMDWEYPVDNGAGYHLPADDPLARPNDPTDATNYVAMLAAIRKAIGTKLLSIAVPSKEGDMLAYTTATVPEMDKSVDFWNIMSYDAVNRRDGKTGYHASAAIVDANVKKYQSFGIKDPKKLNIGFPMYAKWFALNPTDAAACGAAKSPIGCTMGGYEDAKGDGNANSGTWAFNPEINKQWSNHVFGLNATIDNSYKAAMAATGADDTTAAGSAFFDKAPGYFWTWQTPADMTTICNKWKSQVGGVFVWSINQDSNSADGGEHFAALASCMKK